MTPTRGIVGVRDAIVYVVERIADPMRGRLNSLQ